MKKINKVMICGLGAIGLTCANALQNSCELSILADKDRILHYKKNPPIFNGKTINLNYYAPTKHEKQDLIILSVKYNGLTDAINYIKNFVGQDTIIISLLNGITSEKEIAKAYGNDKILYSYYLGHSAVRENNSVVQDGIFKIVFGDISNKKNSNVIALEDFFIRNNIKYEISKDIIRSMWTKYALNIVINQLTAIMNLKYGQIKNNENFLDVAKKLIAEIKTVAEKENVKNLENLERDVLNMIEELSDDGKSSTLQDILAKKKTEADIFSGEIVRLGIKHNISTPYNVVIYKMLQILEQSS